MKKLLIYSAVFLMLNACIPSIHPLYTEEDIYLDDRILGNWVTNGEEGQSWEFIRASEIKSGYFDDMPREKTARLYFTEQGERQGFDVRMLDLGGNTYFDISPNVINSDNSMLVTHLFPVHTFSKVEITDDQIKIRQFNEDWLAELIEQNKIRIKHEKTSDGDIILTASTRSLQKFIEKYGDDPEAYYEAVVLKRG